MSHAHSFNQLVLPLRGVINIDVGDFSGKVTPGECVVVKTTEVHLFTANAEARFLVADIDTLPENLTSTEQTVFAIDTSLVSYLNFVEHQLEHKINQTLEASMFTTFVLLLGEQTLLPKVDNRISAALGYINQNLAMTLKISALAKVACLSETQFKKLFKQQAGLSVMQYITKLRMEKAQALLAHTDYPLQLITERVGYAQVSSFSRRFSLHFGYSPSKLSK